MGSNVDYKTIEDDGALGKPETTAVADSTVNESLSANDSENSRIPLTTDNSVKESPFAGSDSEDDSDSDSDDGLSISTRRSSHSLAQQVFNRTTPHSERDQEQHLYPIAEPTPVRAINPSHSLTSLS